MFRIPLTFCFLFLTVPLLMADPVRIYSTLYDPAENPDRDRVWVQAPTRATFENKTQFIALRSIPDDVEKAVAEAERYEKADLGKIIWPHIGTIYHKNLEGIAKAYKERGFFLFDLWGYIPGASPHDAGFPGGWYHHAPDPKTFRMLEETMGDHWLGMDNGEQDGRYIGAFSPEIFPRDGSRFDAYLQFQRHFEQMGNDLGNRMATLVSLNFGHYFLKEGIYSLIGAETAQGLPNSQVYYAWIRGAGKQYGVLWFGNASVWNRWGWKSYKEGGTGYESHGPTKGTSYNLLKRLMYSQILYNSAAVGFENGWFNGDQLGVIGKIQQSANRWLQQNGEPGTMLTPVAILGDFNCGWSFPRHLYTGFSYRVWGSIGYAPGDYLMNDVTDLLFPGYQDSSYFHDETGFLTATPYGDSTDTLLSDAPGWLLRRYSLVLAANDLCGRAETRDKLLAYVEQGGRLVLTAENLRQFGDFAGVSVGAKKVFAAGTELTFTDGAKVSESLPFELYALNLPQDEGENVKILAKCGEMPAAAEVKLGKGTVTVLASPFGISTDRAFPEVVANKVDEHLANPYPLLAHARKIIAAELDRTVCFTVGEGLGSIVCRKGKGVYTVGIFNNQLKELPFKIESRIGKITSIRELPVDVSERSELGFLPGGFEDAQVGTHTDSVMAGADVRVFEVKVEETNVEEIPYVAPEPRAKNSFLRLAGLTMLKEQLLARPTFFQHYDGVLLDWHYFHARSMEQIEEEVGWVKRSDVRVAVDFSSGLNLYPDLRLTKNDVKLYEKSMNAIQDVIEKASRFGAENVVIRGHINPGAYPAELCGKDFQESFAQIADWAKERGMTVTFRVGNWENPPRSLQEYVELRGKMNRENVQYGVTLSAAKSQMDVQLVKNLNCAEPGVIFICGRVMDPNNANGNGFQVSLGSAPLADAAPEPEILKRLKDRHKDAIWIYDVNYADQNAEYNDLKIMNYE